MKKSKKISIIFLIILLLIIFYLIITTKKVDKQSLTNINTNITQNNKIKEKELTQDDYKKEISKYFSEYLEAKKKENITNNELLKIENKILALKVPTEFKDLHIKFVLAISKMRQYLEDNNEDNKKESDDVIANIKISYSWINI